MKISYKSTLEKYNENSSLSCMKFHYKQYDHCSNDNNKFLFNFPKNFAFKTTIFSVKTLLSRGPGK